MAKESGKPKIAILMNSFWNSGAGMSGGDMRMIQVFERIHKSFLSIDIYTSPAAKKSIQGRIKGAKYHLSDKRYDLGDLRVAYTKRSKWAINELLKKEYNILYGSSDFFTDVNPIFEYKKVHPEVRWVQCIFHIYPDWRKRPGSKITNLVGSVMQNRSFKKIRKSADAVVNINNQVVGYLVEKKGFKKEKVFMNPCGADLNYFKSLKGKSKKNHAVFLARLKPSKGIFDLVTIWKHVVKIIPKATLTLIGGGDDEIQEKLVDEIEKAGLKNQIQLAGFLPQNEVFKLVKSGEVFVLPSHEEGFGIVIAEAMACGLPAVVWNLEVYKEVFPKGLLVAPEGNHKRFAYHIIKLMTDKKFNEKISNQAKEMVKKYSLNEIAKEEKDIILNRK